MLEGGFRVSKLKGKGWWEDKCMGFGVWDKASHNCRASDSFIPEIRRGGVSATSAAETIVLQLTSIFTKIFSSSLGGRILCRLWEHYGRTVSKKGM
jgi:hypothetical protein